MDGFKTFLKRGNVVELAVAVIMGGAFGKIVSSLVDDLIMPVIGLVMGGVNFSGLAVTVQNAVIKYGSFIQNVVNFVIIAAVVYMIVRQYEKATGTDVKKDA